MSAPIHDLRMELAHRTSDGIEISLFWNRPKRLMTVEVFDPRLD